MCAMRTYSVHYSVCNYLMVWDGQCVCVFGCIYCHSSLNLSLPPPSNPHPLYSYCLVSLPHLSLSFTLPPPSLSSSLSPLHLNPTTYPSLPTGKPSCQWLSPSLSRLTWEVMICRCVDCCSSVSGRGQPKQTHLCCMQMRV